MTAGRVLIGRILKAHGIRGEVSFSATGDDPGSLRPGLVVYLDERGRQGGEENGDEAGGGRGEGTLTVRAVRAVDRFWLLSFDEVADREVAESLAGRSLFIEEEALPPLPEGEYYHFQLVGLAVTRPDGTSTGRVTRVIDMPGHDLLEVQCSVGESLTGDTFGVRSTERRGIERPGIEGRGIEGRGIGGHSPAGDFLVPIRREFVEWIDLERGEIRLADRADLLEAQSKTTASDEGGESAGRRKMKMRAERRRKRPRGPSPDPGSESAS